MDNQNPKPKSYFAHLCVVQAVCIAVMLIAVVVIKLFFKNSYIELGKWCDDNLFEKTKITADFDGD